MRCPDWLKLGCVVSAVCLLGTAMAWALSSPLLVTEKDDGMAVQVMTGHLLEIQLPGTPKDGHTWVLPSDIGPLVGGRQRPSLDGTVRFKFIAKEPGTVALTLDYRCPVDNDPPTRTFTVTVNVIPCEKK